MRGLYIIATWLLLSAAEIFVVCVIGTYLTTRKLSKPCKCGGYYKYWCSAYTSCDSCFKCNVCGKTYWTSYARDRFFPIDEQAKDANSPLKAQEEE